MARFSPPDTPRLPDAPAANSGTLGGMMATWSQCAADFARDGSLRDVYVLGGGIEAWDALLRLARTWDARFSLNGVAQPLPDSAREVFAAKEGRGALVLDDLYIHFDARASS